MNKRKWKKYNKKKEQWLKEHGLWIYSNILLENIANQILNNEVVDCGIRIKRTIEIPNKNIRMLGEKLI